MFNIFSSFVNQLHQPVSTDNLEAIVSLPQVARQKARETHMDTQLVHALAIQVSSLEQFLFHTYLQCFQFFLYSFLVFKEVFLVTMMVVSCKSSLVSQRGVSQNFYFFTFWYHAITVIIVYILLNFERLISISYGDI